MSQANEPLTTSCSESPATLCYLAHVSAEGEKMGKLLQSAQVEETQLLEEVDRILALEREIKKAQISLMVRIKNALTPAQQWSGLSLAEGHKTHHVTVELKYLRDPQQKRMLSGDGTSSPVERPNRTPLGRPERAAAKHTRQCAPGVAGHAL
jgi:hypothetical protein